MEISISSNSIIVYRGLTQKYDPRYSQTITWVSTSKDYSKLYTDNPNTILQFKLRIPKNGVIDLGFRICETSVDFKEVSSRIIGCLMDKFEKKAISERKARALVDRIHDTKINGFMPVYAMMEQKEVLAILKDAGYSIIRQRESNSGVVTFGVLDKKLLKLMDH